MSGFSSKLAMFGVIISFFSHFYAIPVSAEVTSKALVEQGYALYEDAQFGKALEAFERATEGDGLSRNSLIALLEGRALVHFAMRQTQPMEQSLVQLASIDPKHAFGSAAPPEVMVAFQTALQRIRGQIRIEIKRESIFEGELLQTQVRNDVGDLVRQVRVYARTRRGAWSQGVGLLRVHAPRYETVEYYAIAIGPGGAHVAALASSGKPATFTVGVANIIPPASVAVRTEEGVHPLVWMGIGAAIGALITGAVVLIVNEVSEDDKATSAALLGTSP